MYNRNSDIDMDQVASFLEDAVYKVKNQENPEILDDVKKVFKKNVPFSLRMYVAAYLVKEAQKHFRGGYRSQRRNFQETKGRFQNERPAARERKNFNEGAEERTPRPRVQIDPEVSATIFISIGRNRRVFPRDLVGLLISVGGLERDRIGDIRVLANYSFVQLFAEDAEKAIAALDGYDYRGRKLAVSYSKQKAEDEADSEDLNENAESQVNDEMDAQSAEDEAAYRAAEKAAANNEPFQTPHNLTSN
ncbi:MAG: DbpA RNA binding domain-containing protein [Treponema sp.]|nr:DbpA RNA binding domain-containing protein [Treponema sp.]